MKTKLKNLNSALTFLLEAMYDAEKRIQNELPRIAKATSPNVKKLLMSYLETAADKRMKLKRIFSYLLSGPYKRKSRVIKGVMEELEDIAEISGPAAVRDLLVMNAVSSLAQYKSIMYQNAGDIAARLELEPVVELINEIVNWEKEAAQSFRKIQNASANVLQKEKAA
jgi:ferritin-like metal-binding protein YciE